MTGALEVRPAPIRPAAALPRQSLPAPSPRALPCVPRRRHGTVESTLELGAGPWGSDSR